MSGLAGEFARAIILQVIFYFIFWSATCLLARDLFFPQTNLTQLNSYFCSMICSHGISVTTHVLGTGMWNRNRACNSPAPSCGGR